MAETQASRWPRRIIIGFLVIIMLAGLIWWFYPDLRNMRETYLHEKYLQDDLANLPWVPDKLATPQPAAKDLPDEYAVYAAMLRDTYWGYGEQTIVIYESTRSIYWDENITDEDQTWMTDYLREHFPIASRQVIQTFTDIGREEVPLEAEYDFGFRDYYLIGDEELDVLVDTDTYFDQFYDSPGLIFLSRVAFNSSQTEAIVYEFWALTKNSACGGIYYYLRKIAGIWRVILSQWRSIC